MLKEIETKTKWISDRLIQYVDIVFGVVVGQSLIRNKDLLVNPFLYPFASLALIVVLSTVTLSWMGYHKSMYKYPYKAERISKKRLRPFTDFIIVVTYTYFLFTVESYKTDVVNINLFSFVFSYVLFFGLYLLDGFIRIWEYHDTSASKIDQLRTFFISYLVLLGLYIFSQKSNLINIVFLNYGTILICSGVYLRYRLAREPYHAETIFTIVVDVDGVLADQVTPVLENINKEYGSNYKKADIVLWDQPLPIANTNIKIEIENSHKAETFILNMEPIDNSIRVLTELSKLCEIKIATNRPAVADKSTKKWLRKYKIPFDYYINTSKAGKGAAIGNLIIDDYPKNTLDFTQHEGRIAFLFNQPWNEKDTSTNENSKITRVKDWNEILEKIRAIPYRKL